MRVGFATAILVTETRFNNLRISENMVLCCRSIEPHKSAGKGLRMSNGWLLLCMAKLGGRGGNKKLAFENIIDLNDKELIRRME